MSATGSAPPTPSAHRRRAWPRAGSLRLQLALAIALVTALGVGGSFVAVYRITSSGIQAQIDSQLRTQRSEWESFAMRLPIATPGELERAAAAFIAAQRYHTEALIIAVQVRGGSTVANQRDLREVSGLFAAPLGITDATVAEAGASRVLSTPILSAGRRVGTLRVASPLAPLEHAQTNLLHAFLLVGLLALALAVAVGFGIATLIASPLRRMARVAVAVDSGDLSVRVGAEHGGSRAAGREVRVLAESFDRMLDRLERTFRRQRDFVSDASHELRTPLTVLRVQVELLDDEIDEQRRHEATRTLLRRIDELDRLVGDMLTLAGAEAAQLVEPRTIDLGDFFEDLRRDLPLFGDRSFELEPVTGTLHADPDRLTQLLRNLIRNAVAHTEPSGRIAIAARPYGSRLEISVSDDGPGIPPDQLELIFERFRRLDPGRSRDRGGSGLGLAIARAIAEAHGGRLWAESGPGRGATFRLELPGYEAQPAGDGEEARTSRPPAATRPWAGRRPPAERGSSRRTAR